VAHEVRVFPLVALDGQASPHLEPVLDGLRRGGFKVETPVVPFEFQRGATTMLRLSRPS